MNEKTKGDRRMKRILVIVIALLLIGCTSNDLKKKDVDQVEKKSVTYEKEFELTTSFEKKLSEHISLKIDPKIESTYLIAQMISDETGYGVYFTEEEYVTDQIERFSEYKDHEVFSILKKMINQGFSYDAISGVLHYYDDDLELLDKVLLDEEIMERAGGKEQVREFLDALYDFRKVSKYDEYFVQNKPYYEGLLKRAKKHIEESNMEQIYLEYYGESLGDVVIVITPVCPMGFGNRIEFENKKVLMPTLNVSLHEEKYISFLLHEISHSYVNPQTDLRLEEVNSLKALFEPIKSSMGRQAYNNWEVCLNEHIVRANVILMIEDLYGEFAIEKKADYIENRDFIYLDNVLSSLEEYLENREEYPTFYRYYDTIIDNLKNEL